MINYKSIYQFKIKTLQGKEVSLSDYQGKVILIVNTATKCGEAPQFEQLEALYQKYKSQGFEILSFPSNQFAQEPEEGSSLTSTCEINWGVSFQIFEKVNVRGKNAHPLFTYFGNKKENGKFSAQPFWNFYKYVIDRNGNVIDYFITYTKPTSKKVVKCIEQALLQK